MATTKQDLINQLATYDKATLDRLIKYADLMLIPQADMLVSTTAIDMVNRAHQLADIFFPEWTDRGKADFGEFLVELMANFSEKDFWYINALANETILTNMTVYSNAYSRALSLGYTPTSNVNARYRFRLNFLASTNSNPTIIPIGGLIIESQLGNYYFTNYREIYVQASATSIDTELVQGKFEEQTSLFNGKSIRLTKANIDSKYMYLESDNDIWTQVSTFSESKSTDKVYIALPNENGSSTIVFGDNGFGFKPPLSTSIKVRYLFGNSVLANSLPQNTSYLVKETPRGITNIVQISQTIFAEKQESLESIKVNAPLFFRTRGRILNLRDCIDYLQSLSSVRKAQALSSGTSVYFYIVPEEELTTNEELELLAELELSIKENPILGFDIFGLSTTYVNLNYDFSLPNPSSGVGGINLDAFVLAGYSLTDVDEEIRLLIQRYTDPRDSETAYGKDFVLSELSDYLISNITGLQNIVFNSVAGLVASNIPGGIISVQDNQILAKLLDSNIVLTTQY